MSDWEANSERKDGERRHAEGRRSARLGVTQTLSEATGIAEAAGPLLRAICQGLGWDVGALWLFNRHDGLLRCLDVWHVSHASYPEFIAQTRQRTFEPGMGLPGRVQASGEPVWILDIVKDANFPRAPFAAKEGLHAALASPILLGAQCLGVIEFFTSELRDPDPDLLEMMATIGGQMGQFIERTRALQAVRESEQRFVRFMQHLPGLAWIKDAAGRYVFANDAAEHAFRTPRHDLYGKTDDEVFPPETAALFKANDAQARQSPQGVQVIETLTHDDGIVHHSLVSKFPIPESNGAPALVGGMAIDITDRLRAEESLREADRLKDEFLAMLAHELRNPLAPIRNSLHIMKQQGIGPRELEQFRDMAERQVAHMARLLDDLLDVSRISRGWIELRKEIVDLKPLLNRTVEAIGSFAEQRRHQITVSLAAEPLRVEGDPTRFEQIVTNLLTNACKYTEPGGHIQVGAETNGHHVVLRVRDNGIGIAPEMQGRIFDLFVQAERRGDRSQGGVGIGLTLVRRLVEMHGGRVDVVSAGLGRGSEFVVHLPRKTDVAATKEMRTDHGDLAALPRCRVLVVDDNQDAADSLAMVLRLAKQDVRIAYGGLDALVKAAEFLPSVVFLDLGMAGMDGYEVARRLRADARFEDVALIALTGWGQQEDRTRTAAEGFDFHYIKPVEPALVHQILANAASRGR